MWGKIMTNKTDYDLKTRPIYHVSKIMDSRGKLLKRRPRRLNRKNLKDTTPVDSVLPKLLYKLDSLFKSIDLSPFGPPPSPLVG